jgi:hypothetical protein
LVCGPAGTQPVCRARPDAAMCRRESICTCRQLAGKLAASFERELSADIIGRNVFHRTYSTV